MASSTISFFLLPFSIETITRYMIASMLISCNPSQKNLGSQHIRGLILNHEKILTKSFPSRHILSYKRFFGVVYHVISNPVFISLICEVTCSEESSWRFLNPMWLPPLLPRIDDQLFNSLLFISNEHNFIIKYAVRHEPSSVCLVKQAWNKCSSFFFRKFSTNKRKCGLMQRVIVSPVTQSLWMAGT